MQVLDDDDDDPPLLNPLGYILFWVQFGLGLGLFVCLVIAIGLLIWCQKKNKHSPAPRSDPELAESNPDQPKEPKADLCTGQRPTISGPIDNLNSAYNEVEESDSESIYNEPFHDDTANSNLTNPFQGWSSFRPVGPPPPPPPQAIPLVVRPVAKVNRSTMTDCHKLKGTLSKGTTKARSDIKSGYIASPESSLERSAGARPKQNLHPVHHQARDDCPVYNLPPLPVRSSSLRHKKREGRKKHLNTADTMC